MSDQPEAPQSTSPSGQTSDATVSVPPVHRAGILTVHPRVVTLVVVLVACLLTYFAGSILSMLMAVLLYVLANGNVAQGQELLDKVWASQLGFPLLILGPQIGLALPAFIAACWSPAGFTRRLKLQRGQWPYLLWVSGALATPLIGFISAMLIQSLVGESENLQQLSEVMKKLTAGGFLIPMAILIGLAPGICEEVVFRGYLQTRLTARYGSLIGWSSPQRFLRLFTLTWSTRCPCSR